MKRYHDIDPLFNQARRLPMEVSIEQVQGFLATSAMPAGATKSWFYSLNFYIMLGIIIGAIALLINVTEASPTIASKVETPVGLELNELQISAHQPVQTAEPDPEPQIALAPSVSKSEEKTPEKRIPTPKEVEQKQKENPVQPKRQSTRQSSNQPESTTTLIVDDVADQLLFNDLPLENFYGEPEIENKELAFLITKEDSDESIAQILDKGRETNVRISNIKIKHRRNGDVKVMKLAFAVPHPSPNCEWKVFRTVELKGFKTYEFGWSVDENGNIVDFWDKLNNKDPSEVPVPQKACGKVKYFCNN